MKPQNDYILLDSNIFLDVIAGFDDNDSQKSKMVLQEVENGKFRGLLISPCLTEIYYQIANKSDDQNAKDFIRKILSIDNLEILPIGREESLKAGAIWSKYNKGKNRNEWLSVVDCLILAVCSLLDDTTIITWEEKFFQVSELNIVKPSSIV